MFRTDIVPPPHTVNVRVTLAPVLNLLHSMNLLGRYEQSGGFSDWVAKTSQAMPDALKRDNRIASHLTEAIEDECHRHDTFPAFVAHLATLDFAPLIANVFRLSAEKLKIDAATLRSDRALYIAQVGEFLKGQGEDEDADLFGTIHDLMLDPPRAKAFLIGHLQTMWATFLEPEWTRVSPMLIETCTLFKQLDLDDLTPLEAIQAVTGRDMTNFWDDAVDREHDAIAFVPSAHIGPYISIVAGPERTAYILFGARVPEGLPSRSSELSLREVLVQLSALADETRLHILELLTHHRELSSADFQTRLGLSQSAASRHLRQLVATGYLNERRRDLNKVFSLNSRRVAETTAALQMLLTRKP